MWITPPPVIDSPKNLVKISLEGFNMLNHILKFFITLSIAPIVCFSAVRTEKEKLIEELTGKSTKKEAVHTSAKAFANKMPLSKRHLVAGIKAYKSKNYILALKHYNTVIIKHKNSEEVQAAYLEKVRLYNEMGLKEQAGRNAKLAQQYRVKKIVR